MSVGPSFILSVADENDAAAIFELQRFAYESEARIYDDWSIPPLVETLDELRADMARCRFIKIALEGRLIGAVRARLRRATVSIERLIVEPQQQGRGFGRRLLKAAEEAFPLAERSELFTGDRSERNLRLYQRCGYRVIRREALSPRVTLVFLEKLLRSSAFASS
jgi:GNAT superfamily N-acetyltransferase